MYISVLLLSADTRVYKACLILLSQCCAVHSQCIEESAACTIFFSGRLTIGHLLAQTQRSMLCRGSVTVFALSLVVLFGGSWYLSLVLCNPYTGPVTSIKEKKPWPATVSTSEKALFKLWPLDRDSSLEKLSFVV